MSPVESVAEKIRKLLKLAEKTTFAAEAASAVGKAQALMLEHKITQMMLDDKPTREEETKDFETPLRDSHGNVTHRIGNETRIFVRFHLGRQPQVTIATEPYKEEEQY